MLKKSSGIYVILVTLTSILTSAPYFKIDPIVLRIFLLLTITMGILLHALYKTLRQEHEYTYSLNNLFYPLLLLFSLIHTTRSLNHNLLSTLTHPVNGPLILLISAAISFGLLKPKLHKKSIRIIYLVTFAILLWLNINNLLSQNSDLYASYSNSFRALQIQCIDLKKCLLGVGVNQFPLLFTHFKNIEYVRSDLWNISTFPYSRSLLTQLLSELGFISLLPIGLIFLQRHVDFMSWASMRKIVLKLIVFITIFIVFPPSTELVLLLTLFLLLLTSRGSDEDTIISFSLSRKWVTTLIVGALIISIWSYSNLVSFLRAEIAYASSLAVKNEASIKTRYDLQKTALRYRPDITKYHSGFVQTNQAILAAFDKKYSAASAPITQKDQLVITQTTQTLIQEVQTIVQLNPDNPESYVFMGETYATLMLINPQAYTWSIAAYEKAVELDPFNLTYLHRLAQISLDHKDYTQSLIFVQRALTLRNDQINTYITITRAFQGLGKNKEAIKTIEYALSSVKNIDEREKSILSSLYKEMK